MALVRCKDHFPEKGGRGRNYVAAVEPVGFPSTAAICGREGTGHISLGHVLLDESEYEMFQQGQRVFEPHSNATHLRVKEPVVEELYTD